MPLARYFLFVGGVLLALLLVSGWVLPKFPMTETGRTDGRRQILPADQFRSEMAGARRFRYQRPADHCRADRSDGGSCHAPGDARRLPTFRPRCATHLRNSCPLTRKNRRRSRSGNAKLQKGTSARRRFWSRNSRGLAFSAATSGRPDRWPCPCEPLTCSASVFQTFQGAFARLARSAVSNLSQRKEKWPRSRGHSSCCVFQITCRGDGGGGDDDGGDDDAGDASPVRSELRRQQRRWRPKRKQIFS